MRRLIVRCAVLVAGAALAVGGGAAAASATTTHQATTAHQATTVRVDKAGNDKPVGVVVQGTIAAIDSSKGDEQVLTLTSDKGKLGVLVTPKTSIVSGTKGQQATLKVGENVVVKGLQAKPLIEALVVIVQ